MATMRLCALNVADTATVTATTANSSYPASNLQSPLRGNVLRTTGVTANREIKLTWASNQTVNFVAIARHNWTASATWRVQLYSDDAWTTQIEDSGTVTAWDGSLLAAMATAEGAYATNLRCLKTSAYYCSALRTTARSIKITLNDTGNADGYLEASRAFVGQYLGLTRNAAYGASIEWAEGAEQMRMDSGSLRTLSVVGPYRRWRLALNYFDAADRKLLSDLARYAGPRRDMWFDLYPGDGTALELEGRGVVKAVARGPFSHTLPAHWNTDLTLEEA